MRLNMCLKSAFMPLLFFLLMGLATPVLLPLPAKGGEPVAPGHQVLRNLVENGAYALFRDTSLIASHNLEAPLVPASISKLLTALAAFDRLGADYRFKTEFFIDDRDNLYIKGYGDPFLVSEEVETIMASLKKAGVRRINAIYIDDSSFRITANADGAGDSANPYDVACNGLAVNFNTINIVVGEDGAVRSGEPQTPLLPIMTRLGTATAPGEYRINISRKPEDMLLLTGQLFRSFQQKAGIPGNGRICRRKPPPGEPLLRHYSSRGLPELLEGLMLYSNNFIANQLFLTIGAEYYGYPASWLKGQQAMKEFIARDQLLAGMPVSLIEGSGLSRHNRMSAEAMLRVLERFRPYAHLLPEKNSVLVKSGTLTGVYSYAGYLPTPDGLDSFVIILNQAQNNRDKILEILKRIHAEDI